MTDKPRPEVGESDDTQSAPLAIGPNTIDSSKPAEMVPSADEEVGEEEPTESVGVARDGADHATESSSAGNSPGTNRGWAESTDAGVSDDDATTARTEGAYSPDSYREKRDHYERDLRDLLLQRVGDDRVAALTAIYADDPVNAEPISVGLNVVIGHTSFGMAWAARGSTPLDTKCVQVGMQRANGRPHECLTLIKRYSSDQVLVAEVDKAAANLGGFWQANADLAGIDLAAKQARLALILLIPDEVRKNWKQGPQQLKQLKEDYVGEGLKPTPWEAFRELLSKEASTDLVEQVGKFEAVLDGTDFSTAFEAWCSEDLHTVQSIIENKGSSRVVADWNAIFKKVIVDPMTREPVAAAALYLASNFPALPQHLFNHVWGILQLVLKEKWIAPEICDEREVNLRRWREDGDDDALFEVDVRMLPGSNGRVQAQFPSDRMAQHFEALISQRGPGLEQLLTSSIFTFARPLNLGIDVIQPAARLFVSRVQARHGDDAPASVIAEELFHVIREHRREADEAISAFQLEHALLEQSEGSAVKAILLHAHALDKSRQADKLVFEVPSFIILSLREFFDQSDNEKALDVIRALWRVAELESGDAQAKLDFWRQVVVGAVYGVDHQQAVPVLGKLFDYSPEVFFTHGRGASAGLWLETLPQALRASADWYATQQGRSEAWSFGALVGLLTFWMHWTAQIERHTGSPIAAPELTDALSSVFLTKRGMYLVMHLSEVSDELASRAPGAREIDEVRQTTLARSLIFKQLQLLYGIRGDEFEAIRKAVDGTGSKGRFADTTRWLPSSSKTHPAFDTWRRSHAACTGLVCIIGEVLVSDADPAARVLAACQTAPDPSIARKILLRGLRFLDQDMLRIRRAITMDQARREAFDQVGGILRKMFAALSIK